MTNANDAPAAQETKSEKLARMRKLQSEREARAAEEKEDAELSRHELVTRFEGEGMRFGKDFTLVDLSELGEPHIVVKLGPGVLWTAFKNAEEVDEVTIDTFVTPNLLSPSEVEFRRIVSRRGAVGPIVALALGRLYGLKAREDAGK